MVCSDIYTDRDVSISMVQITKMHCFCGNAKKMDIFSLDPNILPVWQLFRATREAYPDLTSNALSLGGASILVILHTVYSLKL